MCVNVCVHVCICAYMCMSVYICIYSVNKYMYICSANKAFYKRDVSYTYIFTAGIVFH